VPAGLLRRTFLQRSSQATLALTLSPFEALGARQASGLQKLTAALNQQIPEWMTAASVPGVSLVVIQHARIAWRRGFGVTDVVTRTRVTDETMFEAASMSKPVFAYVVLKLCEEGVLNLDTPLTKYTSQRFLDGDARLDLITARHVLSHTTGFQNWRTDKEPLAIRFTPGSQYQYSGEGYNYLQTVVTQLLKQPFERYMRTRLFEPIGMKSSAYVWDDRAARRMARPHDAGGKPLDNKKSTPQSVARYGSAGALLTSPSDYARFVINVIDPPAAGRFRLKPESLREMLRPHVKVEGGQYPASWALGWQIFHNASRDFLFHGGDNEGFHCGAVASVAGQSGFVVMTNGENGPQVLRNLLTAEAMQEFLAAPPGV
jgi:CubicO group peptidase (beta-lactamase class C family)